MKLKAIRMGIDTHQEYVVYIRSDAAIARAEGISSSVRVMVSDEHRETIATLNVVDPDKLSEGCVGMSNALWDLFDPEHDVTISHAPVVSSTSLVRAKIYNHRLDDASVQAIIDDIARGYYSDVQISAFLSACAGSRLDRDEIVSLTRAMVKVGEQLSWPGIHHIYDKHCIGGLPGNRTTPIVVAIISDFGLVMPKTSSRAITSPAGTADTMEVMTNVDLDIDVMRTVVETTGACLAWGGAMRLSPVDDLLIRVERMLDLDSKGQMVASVLSKKIAAGSGHVLIDVPVGNTAKVRDTDTAHGLMDLFEYVGRALDVDVRCVMTDGSQPIGRGIGPALEARDILAVFRGEAGAPEDLRSKSLELAAHMLVMAKDLDFDSAWEKARDCLDSGRALNRFMAICQAQGRFSEPTLAAHVRELSAHQGGCVKDIDSRRISRLAKLAGAPQQAEAGVDLMVCIGDTVEAGQPLLAIHAESEGELDYALVYYLNNRDMILLED